MLRRRRMGSHTSVERPSTATSPSLGSSRRLISFSVVVLPEPLRPKSTRVSPRRTSRLKSASSRCAFAARNETWRNSMTFCGGTFMDAFRLDRRSARFGPNLRRFQTQRALASSFRAPLIQPVILNAFQGRICIGSFFLRFLKTNADPSLERVQDDKLVSLPPGKMLSSRKNVSRSEECFPARKNVFRSL